MPRTRTRKLKLSGFGFKSIELDSPEPSRQNLEGEAKPLGNRMNPKFLGFPDTGEMRPPDKRSSSIDMFIKKKNSSLYLGVRIVRDPFSENCPR